MSERNFNLRHLLHYRSVFHPNLTTLEYMNFNGTNFYGDLLMKGFNGEDIHRIGCQVTFRNVEKEYQDFITLRYAGENLFFG